MFVGTTRRGTWMIPDTAALNDAARVATRHAPLLIKRQIDRARSRHGMAPLWAMETRSLDEFNARQERTAQLMASASSAGVIIGAACPGLSIPIACGFDRHVLPERFTADAFRFSMPAIEARTSDVWLSARGHDAEPIATVKAGTLRLWTDAEVGLMVEATLPATDEGRTIAAEARCGELFLSVGFVPRQMREVKQRGKRVRLISEAALSHVALIRGEARPAYKAARCYHTFAGDTLRLEATRTRARLGAWRAIHEQRNGL